LVAEGDLLGKRYRLESPIATGGMGTVFAATDERLGRSVAVKLLKDALAQDARFIERFRREARSAASLSHPKIASVYDYGSDALHHFIVMEHAPGRDLARLLREEGPLEPSRAVAIAAQVGEALGAAHDVKMVHRDIKPANIIVDENDNVKVTDFGIARASGDSTLTATGSMLGTAHYLSPEQASGGKIEPPSDVYSLGIVLYEMLTNSVPFTGDSAVAVAMRHLKDEVPAPGELQDGIPREVDALVKGATAKDPARRYANGREFSEAADITATGETTAPHGAILLRDTPERRTEVLPVTPLGERWNPERVGRYVVLFFVGLLALAFALAVVRALQAGDAGDATAPEQTASTAPGNASEDPGVSVPEGLVGEPVTSVVEELGSLPVDLEVTVQPDEESKLEEGLVSRVEPAEGDSVEDGSEVTVFVSSGAQDDGDDDEDDEESPGRSQGKGKGKDKKEKDD
jgi:hypothetical protein